MSKNYLLVFQLLLGILGNAAAQKEVIEVGMDKTTFIQIKGLTLKSAEIGSKLVAPQLDNGILKLKAAAPFKETNMLLIGDTLIELTLRYNQNPVKTLYVLDYSGKSRREVVVPSKEAITVMENKSRAIVKENLYSKGFIKLNNQKSKYGIGVSTSQIKVVCNKIYVEDDNIFIGFFFANSINMEYKLDAVKFQVVTRKTLFNKSQVRNSFLEVIEDVKNGLTVINKSPIGLNYAFKKFALREDEQLVISFFESTSSSRGRNVSIKINSNILNMAAKME